MIQFSDKAQQRLTRIHELTKEIEDAQRELEGLLLPERKVVAPASFSVHEEVKKMIEEAGTNGIAAQTVLTRLNREYPDYGIDRKKVTNSLAYVKKRNPEVAIQGRGVYVWNAQTPS